MDAKEYDYDYIWEDYEYDNANSDEALNTASSDISRIDFAKYGIKNRNINDITESLPRSIFCNLVESLTEKCGQQNLLEIWRYREDLIQTTTQDEILNAVNLLNSSPWFGHDTDYTSLLGGVTRNSTGHIVKASSTIMFWSITVPDNVTIVESQGSGVELELGDQTSLEWEKKFVEISLENSSPEFEFLPNAVSSYGNESAEAIFFDGFLMASGYFLMFLYTCFILGNTNYFY